MPYVYIGNKSPYVGKPLLEILLNLKNFGQGRIFSRSIWDVFTEPCFFRVLLCEPEMDEKKEKGRVLVELVYRGKRLPNVQNISKEIEHPDFRLIFKEDEEKFCRWNEVSEYKKETLEKVMPRYAKMPPMYKMFLNQQRTNNLKSLEEDLSLEFAYEDDPTTIHRVANKSEDANQILQPEINRDMDFNLDDYLSNLLNYKTPSPAIGTRLWGKGPFGTYKRF